jgi:hypothetical protein
LRWRRLRKVLITSELLLDEGGLFMFIVILVSFTANGACDEITPSDAVK